MVRTLFGDVRINDLVIEEGEQEPWRSFAKARGEVSRGDRAAAIHTLMQLAATEAIESRYRIIGWSFVRELGGTAPSATAREVLGVVVEVGMQDGTDLLAAYSDYVAYYYNFSGAAVIWMRPDTSLDDSIERVLAAARAIVGEVDPWRKPRRGAPGKGNARLNILTPSGIHFGEGELAVLSRDAAAGPILNAATSLLAQLTSLPPAAKPTLDRA